MHRRTFLTRSALGTALAAAHVTLPGLARAGGHGRLGTFTGNARYGISADLAGRLAYGGIGSAGTPLEGLLGGWNRFGDSWVLRAGAGTGLTAGIGAPDFRAVMTFGYEPPLVRDSDEDGLLDSEDACKDEPEDMDGWMDTDGCPDPQVEKRS